MKNSKSIGILLLGSLGIVGALNGVAETVAETAAPLQLDLVVVGADRAVREVLSEGAIVRGTADLRLRAPTGSDVRVTLAGRGAGIVTANGLAPLVPQRSLLAGSVPAGPIEVRAEAWVAGAVVATRSWHLMVLGDTGVRSSARGVQESKASANAAREHGGRSRRLRRCSLRSEWRRAAAVRTKCRAVRAKPLCSANGHRASCWSTRPRGSVREPLSVGPIGSS